MSGSARITLEYRCGHSERWWVPLNDCKAKKREASETHCIECRFAEEKGEPKRMVTVRCDSHRARERLKQALGGTLPQSWYIIRNGKMPDAAKGIYKITPEQWQAFNGPFTRKNGFRLIKPGQLG